MHSLFCRGLSDLLSSSSPMQYTVQLTGSMQSLNKVIPRHGGVFWPDARAICLPRFLQLPVTVAPLYRSIYGIEPTGTLHCPIVPYCIDSPTVLRETRRHQSIHKAWRHINSTRSDRPSPSSIIFISPFLRRRNTLD